MDARVARHRQPLGLRLADQVDAGCAAEAAQVDTRAGVADELEDRRQRDGFGQRGHAGEAETRRERPLGGDAVAEPGIVRPQPHRIAEGRRVLQGAVQDKRVADGDVGLREADAARFAELGHLRQLLALQPLRQGAERIEAREIQILGAELEHLDEARFVEHGVGIGRADQARDAARDRRRELGLEQTGMLVARLAQARRQVDEPRRDHGAARIDRPRRVEVAQPRRGALGAADDRDPFAVDGDAAGLVPPARRIDQPRARDQQPIHRRSPRIRLEPSPRGRVGRGSVLARSARATPLMRRSLR